MRTKRSKNFCLGLNFLSCSKFFVLMLFLIIISNEKAKALDCNFINKKIHYGKFQCTIIQDLINPIAYVLLWDSAKFAKWYNGNKGKKIIFRFYYADDATRKNLTIAGWPSDANDYFDNDPSINNPDSTSDFEILQKQSIDNLDLSKEKFFFLGNIKISGWILNRINKGLKTNNFILLKPVLDSDNHLIYEVYLQTEDPHKPFSPADKTVSPKATLIGITDPSPPATYK